VPVGRSLGAKLGAAPGENSRGGQPGPGAEDYEICVRRTVALTLMEG
jgi:hypothetical protein